ncbi:hypothetical protein N825_26135 [Skermanella stibiiresistens SB22]|uniref:Exo-alpha-sialidase n=1 Tax=Skermanella stibiiresistens SB22 TaxID=1385369 RepID=W9GV87_9PROT|nr:hypothetical protein [Skermanella stibiiresistens]EWY36352.1 hypothetical protein N825_26135 [Skermanella stibiiresistens SB22]
MSKRTMALILAVTLVSGLAGQAGAQDLSLTIPPGAEPEIVFDHDRDACEKFDVPDVPTRAFRMADETIRLIASHWTNRAFSGPDLDHLSHPCDIVYEGGNNDDPAAFDDRGWLVSTYTLDGVTVHGLVHNEFQGHRRPALCPTGRYMDCWYNTVTYVVSKDGGRSFKPPATGSRLVAALPYRYDPTRGKRSGLFNPSNIIRRGDHFYTMMTAAPQEAQAGGVCLMRTDRLDEPTSWRAWDGHDFTVRFADPYRDGGGGTCVPLPGLTRLMASLSLHRPSGLYIGLFTHQQRPPGGSTVVDGVFYATSPDLVTWSKPRLLFPTPTTLDKGCDTMPVVYPALIDPDSPSRNFEDTDDDAHIYMTRISMDGCKTGWTRNLVRLRVHIER